VATILWAVADRRDELNTSYYRCLIPAKILDGRNGHRCVITHIYELSSEKYDPEFQEIVDSADVILLERLLLSELWPHIDKWHAQGKKVVGLFDDAYHLMPPSGGASALSWRGGKSFQFGTKSDGTKKVGAILTEFRQTLRMCDTAIVPSRLLADDYRQFCPTIQYIPNVSPPELWDKFGKRPPDNNFIIGWGGSTAHWESFRDSGIVPALATVCRNNSRVYIHLQNKDPRIAILLDKAGLQGRYSMHFWTTFEAWPQIVKSWDLYICPIASQYDLRRSFLKQIEAGMAGIPWVASNLGSFKEGVGGLLVNNKSAEWDRTIEAMISDNKLRANLSTDGHTWAESLYRDAGRMYEVALGI